MGDLKTPFVNLTPPPSVVVAAQQRLDGKLMKAALRHTPLSATSYVQRNGVEVLLDGQPLAPAVRQWLPKVRAVLMRDQNNRALIVGCMRRNIDPHNSGFLDDPRVILFENDESTRRVTKIIPAHVGVLFQARWLSHGRMLPLVNDARARGVLIVPTLKPTEIRQLITLGRLPEQTLLARLQPHLPTNITAALELASPEMRAATDAALTGGMRKYVHGEAVPEPIEIATSPTDEALVDHAMRDVIAPMLDTAKGKVKSSAVKNFVLAHPALPGEKAATQARRLRELWQQEGYTPVPSFHSFENTVSYWRKRAAPVVPPTSAPPPEAPIPLPAPQDEPAPPPPPRPVNDAPSTGGSLDKTMSAIDALADSLSEIELHAERMSNHGKVLAEHGRQLAEQIGFAKFAIDNLRGDLKTSVQADIEQKLRAAIAHVMGPLA